MLERKNSKKLNIIPILEKASSIAKAFYHTAGLNIMKTIRANAVTIKPVKTEAFSEK
jgi:septin family protein